MQKEVPYTEAINLKYPEQVVIAIAKDKNGKCNPIRDLAALVGTRL